MIGHTEGGYMRPSKSWLMVLGIVVALTMAFGANIASALRSISIASPGAIIATSGALTLSEGGGEIICAWTLSGEMLGSFPKTAGALVGRIRTGRIEIRTCRVGGLIGSIEEVSVLFPEEWHQRFVDFEGTLPRITGVKLQILRLRWLLKFRALSIQFACLFTVDQSFRARVAAEEIQTLELIRQAIRTPVTLAGSATCPEPIELAGNFRLERARRVRLI